MRADYDIFFDDRKLADLHLRPDARMGMNARALRPPMAEGSTGISLYDTG